jgi:uncharacterized OsmC-like protein
MRDSIPISFIRIWCRKNDFSVGFKLRTGDSYNIDAKKVSIGLPDGTYASVNTRHVFPVRERYPVLLASDIEGYDRQYAPVLYGQPPDPRAKRRRATFDEIVDEVESYVSLLGKLEPVEKYVAIRLCETGVVSILQLNAAVNRANEGESLGAAVLRLNFCTWEQMLCACLDIERMPTTTAAGGTSGFELSGEILVSLGKITRTQLEHAIKLKRDGSKPLGEILVQMGACTPGDVRNCLAAQEAISESVVDSIGLIGDLLVQHGRITPDQLTEALRMQHVGRQPLHAVLISMGACSKAAIAQFKQDHGIPQSSDNYNEDVLGSYLVQSQIISDKQLHEARRIQNKGRQVLGELLVSSKACTQDDVELALNLQQHYRRSKPATKRREKLGEMLIKRSLVAPEKVADAARTQELGKQKMGATLISLGACTHADFADALELQFNWREQTRNADDKLGQELVRSGAIDESKLKRALDLHGKAGKPLGEILIEQHACTPETVIDTLIKRDEKRKQAFEEYVKQMRPTTYTTTARRSDISNKQQTLKGKQLSGSIVDRISNWLKRD